MNQTTPATKSVTDDDSEETYHPEPVPETIVRCARCAPPPIGSIDVGKPDPFCVAAVRALFRGFTRSGAVLLSRTAIDDEVLAAFHEG